MEISQTPIQPAQTALLDCYRSLDVNSNCTDSTTITVVRVADLSPGKGTLVSTNPPTYILCPVPTNAPNPYLTICATPCPWWWWMTDTNLPACWQMTGGLPATNADGTISRTCRRVDRRQLGTTTITATAGCSSNTVVIIVQDTNPPALYCYDVGLCTDAGACSSSADLHNWIFASDDCGEVTIDFAPSGPYNQGPTEVTATATDAAGNSTNCTFNVVVYDCEAPHITCPGDIVVCAGPTGTNIVTWSTPSASDNCAVTSVSCYPPSGYDFPVGETTVYCTATDSSGKQDTCSFTVTVVQVDVTNIKFNHNTSSSASDALNLRQDYSTAYDISNGEWIQGGANLPVCYTTNKSVTIKVRLTVQPASITRADIWAVSTDARGALGDVTKTTVTFSGGVSSPEYVTFSLANNTPTTIKKTTNDVWQWKMGNINGHGSAACDANVSGPHTVYTILAEPTPPWVNTWGSQKNAWTVVLDYACVWAAGATDESSAVSEITLGAYTNFGKTYDGWQTHTEGDYCNLTGMLAGSVVDCRDMSAVVQLFTRITGGSTVQVRIVDGPFKYKPILPIGCSSWETQGWNFHQFGWHSDSVNDACVKLKQSAPYVPVHDALEANDKPNLYDSGRWVPLSPFTINGFQ